MNLLMLRTAGNAGIIPHHRLGTNSEKKHQSSLLWPRKEGTEREREVNLGGGGSELTLNSPPVIVRSLMTRQNWSRNRAAQRSVGLGGQLSDEDKMVVGWEGGPSVPLLDPAYRGSGALTSVITHGCVIVLCCCPRR